MPKLQKAFCNLCNKAMGIDKIHNSMLSHISLENRAILLNVLIRMFLSGFVPEDVKCALVAPIPKPNKTPNRVDSYRPISLTSCLGKVMEILLMEELPWQTYGPHKIPSRIPKRFLHHRSCHPHRICNQKEFLWKKFNKGSFTGSHKHLFKHSAHWSNLQTHKTRNERHSTKMVKKLFGW